MQNQKIAIVTDSTCDIDTKLLNELGVICVDLKVTKDDGTLCASDNSDASIEEFYDYISTCKELPKTSMPSPIDFGEVYTSLALLGYTHCISIHISSAMSGTCQAARLGAESANIKVEVIDSKRNTLALALIVRAVANKRNDGMPFDELLDFTKRICLKSNIVFSLDTLRNLVKGGRTGKATALAASVLNIKPILALDDEGQVVQKGKARALKGAWPKIVKIAKEAQEKFGPLEGYFVHARNLAGVDALRKQFDEHHVDFKELGVKKPGPVITTHVCTGCAGFAYIPRDFVQLKVFSVVFAKKIMNVEQNITGEEGVQKAAQDAGVQGRAQSTTASSAAAQNTANQPPQSTTALSFRAAQDVFLDASVSSIRAISDSRAKNLAKLNIHKVRDLLTHFPYRYIDLTNIASCANAPIGQQATVIGTIDSVRQKKPRPYLDIIEAAIVDDTGILLGVWFRQPWMAKRLKQGMRVALGGKVTFDYGYKRIVSPTFEVLNDSSAAPRMLMIPVHHATQGITTAFMRRFVANALEACCDIHDFLPLFLRQQYGFMNRKAALFAIHFPQSKSQYEQARRRLAYEEVLCLQLKMMSLRLKETADTKPIVHTCAAETKEELSALLPFELTPDQKTSVDEILQDMCCPTCMNRMLLGDVGCGKTIVAAFALVCAARSGHQGAMMAPTEVLAQQYGKKLGGFLDKLDITWATLTSSTKAKEKKEIAAGLADGSIQIVFGTHALTEPNLDFADLSLVIIDEQHRFGVNQRAALRAKGAGSDLLVMTATPIPRTLALTLYGDLQTSYIRTRPANRAKTKTKVISRNAKGKAYEKIAKAVEAGRQAYIICPLVGLSAEARKDFEEEGGSNLELDMQADVSDKKAAENEARFLASKVFPQFKVGLLTGKMKSDKKRETMKEFSDGDIDILVATTVVEVGVDVPNATVMLVEDAQMFGLAQLHQLRGRISRSSVAGQFFLVADFGKDDSALKDRMQALCNTDDGFELAELDLQARKEGNVVGKTQHGQGALKLVNVIDDEHLIKQAHKDAQSMLKSDPQLCTRDCKEDNLALSREIAIRFAQLDEELNQGA